MARFASVAHTERGLDRLINFSDAVIAIAATLLILPIVEITNDILSKGGELSDLLSRETRLQVASFAVGFYFMTMFWRRHHEIFERVKDYSPGLIVLNFLWLISMVFFAFPIGFLYQSNVGIASLYLVNLGIISVLLSLTRIYISRHPNLSIDPEQKLEKNYFIFAFVYPALLFLTVLATSVLDANAFFLLLLGIPIRLFSRRYKPPPPTHTERGMDRVVNFSDAVVAIAITLLILPLVDIITDDRGNPQDLFLIRPEVIAKIIVFAFTFWLMSRQWLINHRLFENVRDYSRRLIRLTFLWLLLIVFVAIPSALMGHSYAGLFGVNDQVFQDLISRFPQISLLFGTVLAFISLTTAFIKNHLKRHPELLVDPKQPLLPRANYYVAVLYSVVGAAPLLLTGLGYESLGFWSPLGFLLLPFVIGLAARQDAVKGSTRTPSEV